MIDFNDVIRFYKGKTVLVSGNTGFKGSWMTYVLLQAGANVIGYSLKSPTEPALFDVLGLGAEEHLTQIGGDVRDLEHLLFVFEKSKPEIVIHLAAQPIVRESYRDPVGTYSTNVMGTVNVCEAVRLCDSVQSFLNVTTDKVYRNNEWEWGYRETEYLDGYDPYSNSKSCSELVTAAYRRSFMCDVGDNAGKPVIGVSTARAGNVIGGGDFSSDRIIPDCVRAIKGAMGSVELRNPASVRPYQHVLESVFAYLMIAMRQYEDVGLSGSYNVGPDECDCVCTSDLVDMFCSAWNNAPADGYGKLSWKDVSEPDAPHEANFLKLDTSRIKSVFDWQIRWHIDGAIRQTVEWNRVWLSGGDVRAEMDREIKEYMEG